MPNHLPFKNVVEAMKAYAALGWPVIPLCPYDHAGVSKEHRSKCSRPGKTPLIKEWTEANVPSDETIEEWARQWPSMNVGLVLGTTSGIVAIDIDGTYGEELLNEWSGGELPDTLEFSTPGGGRRLLYTVPSGLKTAKHGKAHPEKQHEECALLGDGYQTVLPPSRHENGGLYSWKGGCNPWEC